jgi:hypothetical protein
VTILASSRPHILTALSLAAAACGPSSSGTTPAAPSTAAVDQSSVPVSGTQILAPLPVMRAQTFTVGVNGSLTGVDVIVVAVSSAPSPVAGQADAPIQVRTTVAGSCASAGALTPCVFPTTAAAASGVLPAAMVAPYPGPAGVSASLFRHVEFTPPLAVTAGQVLALTFPTVPDVAVRVGADTVSVSEAVVGTSTSASSVCAGPSYARGSLLFLNSTVGVWSLDPCSSAYFRTYVVAR